MVVPATTARSSSTAQAEDALHDANGNRTALERRFTKGQVTPDTVDSYALAPGTNRLASITTDSLTRNLIYDARGNLSTETRGPAVTATTAYDGHGRLLIYARTSEDSLARSYNGLDDCDAKNLPFCLKVCVGFKYDERAE